MEFDLQTLFGGVSTVGVVSIAGVLLRGWFDDRRVKMDESASARTTYEHLVGLLTSQLTAVQAQHAACDQQIAGLRKEQLRLERQIIALTLRYAIPIEKLPPAVASALGSMANILTPSDEEETHDDAPAS